MGQMVQDEERRGDQMEVRFVVHAAGQLVADFDRAVGQHDVGFQKSNHRRFLGVQSR